MQLLIYEPSHMGHYFAYLGRMLPGFTSLPIEITFATTAEGLRSVEFETSLARFQDRVRFVPCCTVAPRPPVANARHRLRELRDAIDTLRPDHVMIGYADGIWEQAYISTLVGRRPWSQELTVEGWLFRGRFADPVDRRWKSRLRRLMFVQLLRRGLFRRLHLHHELLYNFAAPQSAGTPTSVVLTADPVVIRPLMGTSAARRELGIEDISSGRWIGVAGVIAKFKGAHLFLEAYRIRRERGDQPVVRALVAGPQEDNIRAMLRSPPYCDWVGDGSIVSIDRFLSEEQMYAAAAAVDVVVAPYPHHQNRSSIILWAAAAGRPAIGPNESCVGYVIEKERLGASCHVQDASILADTISATLNAPWTQDDICRVRNYAGFHRIENYQAISSQLVRERLGAAGC